MAVTIRAATEADFEQIWPIFHEVAAAGDTYGYRPDTSMDQAFHLWMEYPRCTYVAEEDGQIGVLEQISAVFVVLVVRHRHAQLMKLSRPT